MEAVRSGIRSVVCGTNLYLAQKFTSGKIRNTMSHAPSNVPTQQQI